MRKVLGLALVWVFVGAALSFGAELKKYSFHSGSWSFDLFLPNISNLSEARNQAGISVGRSIGNFEPTITYFRWRQEFDLDYKIKVDMFSLNLKYYLLKASAGGVYGYGGWLLILYKSESSYFRADGKANSYIVGAGADYNIFSLVYLFADVHYYKATFETETTIDLGFFSQTVKQTYEFGGERILS